MEIFLGAFEHAWEQRRAAFLHERLIGRTEVDDEEERRRRRGATIPIASEASLRGRRRGEGGGRPSEPAMRTRFEALASGSQPAVVKLASFGGSGRVRAMIQYISRDGEVAVENERGEVKQGRDALSEIPGEWDHLMQNRRASDDIGTFLVSLPQSVLHSASGDDAYERARAALERGLGERRFAFTVFSADGDGRQRVEGVVVLRDRKGERLTADRVATDLVRSRWANGDREDNGATSFRFTGRGNGTDYGAARLRNLVDRSEGLVQDEQGRLVSSAQAAKDLVQLEWRGELHSRKPRDVMHLILSARAGTDVAAFRAAAGDFLAAQFPGHRYVFSVHDPSLDPKAEEAGGKRPHVHVHAIVVMQSDYGDRIETTVASFRQWRVTMAEKAREQGITMEMTDRRDRASAPAYRRSHVRPMHYGGRTEHEATSAAAQRRYADKRGDEPHVATSRQGRLYAEQARHEWSQVAKRAEQSAVREMAREQMTRLAHDRSSDAAARGVEGQRSFATYQDCLAALMETIGEKDMREMTREAFKTYEQRVETALSEAQRLVPPVEKAAFDEVAIAAREHVNLRRSLLERQHAANPEDHRTGQDDNQRVPDGRSAHDNARRWDMAVARHGADIVNQANRIMLEVEYYRDQIEGLERRNASADLATMRAKLDRELSRAGEMGAAGNSLIREISETDQELRAAIEAAQRSRSEDRKRDDRHEPDHLRGRDEDDRQ